MMMGRMNICQAVCAVLVPSSHAVTMLREDRPVRGRFSAVRQQRGTKQHNKPPWGEEREHNKPPRGRNELASHIDRLTRARGQRQITCPLFTPAASTCSGVRTELPCRTVYVLGLPFGVRVGIERGIGGNKYSPCEINRRLLPTAGSDWIQHLAQLRWRPPARVGEGRWGETKAGGRSNMVQLTVSEGEVAPAPGYAPAFLLPAHDLPHTALGLQSPPVGGPFSQFSPMGGPSPQSPLFPDNPSQLICDPSGPDAPLTPSFLTSLSLGSIDTLPVTVLASACDNGNTGCPPQLLSPDSTAEGGKTFEVIPVSEGHYGGVDNAPADPTLSLDSGLQKDTRADSVDSLLEIRGYSSDSSDVYMNSDYTDTVTSADSTAFLLSDAKSDHGNTDASAMDSQQTSANFYSNEQTSANFYSNEAFNTHSGKELATLSSDESVSDSKETVEKGGCSGSGGCGGVSRDWSIVPIPEDDSGELADREDEEEEGEGKELMPLARQVPTLENLVNQLAEQHPQEVVDIRIEVLDQPVYSPLTEPLEEGSWLQSTDSLYHYKLLKQGRSTTLTNLRVQALTSLRANTMNNLHERSSFLNLTATSVSNLGHACQKALSYVRADMEFGSMMSLGHNLCGSTLLRGQEDPPHAGGLPLSGKKGGQPAVASGRHTRNVVLMALIVTMLLVAVNTTRNLQSSLNQEGGVGIVCLAAMFASYTLGSVLSPLLVQRQGVRACLVLGLLLQLLYVAANLYPVLWLMLPVSLGGGASMAVIWNAMSTYIVLLARGEAHYSQKSYQRVSDKYFGIFCLIYQTNLIVGNLIASLVLTFAGGDEGSVPVPLNGTDVGPVAANVSSDLAGAHLSLKEALTGFVGIGMGGNITDNSSTTLSPLFDATVDSHYHLCGSEFCHHFVVNQESLAVPARTVYLLFGIFMVLVVGAILMAILLLEPLAPRPLPPSPSSAWSTLCSQLLSLVRFSRNAKFILVLPLLLYGTMQFSFVCSEVMMAYITCPVGVWLVGYTMIGYGVSCSLGSYITQALVPRIGRGFFISLESAARCTVSCNCDHRDQVHRDSNSTTESAARCTVILTPTTESAARCTVSSNCDHRERSQVHREF
ncbi:hypothetical protein ACOMHN_003508 [Nucella lapillus]